MTIFILIYLILGLVCVGVAWNDIYRDYDFLGEPRLKVWLAYFVVAGIVLIIWPVWIGMWLSNHNR